MAAFVVDQLEELYRRMWVLRLLDMALEQLRIEGLINGPLQGGFGQEAVSVGAAAALGEGDVIITTHRPHAQHVGTDAPLGPVIADMLGATAGDLEGADEDAHIADPRAGLPAAIRVVKQSPLLAIGHAYALWLRDTGRVTLCVTQDCDVDADAFNEAADLAAVWQLPVVILVENIRGALSVHLDRYTHEPRVYRRAVAYGMPGVSVDGNDVEAVRDCVANAVVRARAGGGPTLVQAITYRTTDFSGSDRGGYRDSGRIRAVSGSADLREKAADCCWHDPRSARRAGAGGIAQGPMPWLRQGQGAAQRRWANQPTNIRLAPTTKDPVLRPRCTLAADNAVGTCRRAAAPASRAASAASPRRPRQLGR
ncbi:dehydrogenase [Mycobacterium tuberculosis CAS/NITR204]|uniref:Dehydrogenase n=1 Tax=Mycobacterium tuberculosis CAS/NITR204 TaxID=1310114 RepID=R4MEF3_MYCTX|nr:dehydrogenase [Mycobacterium tuberculosis CAS/NITR204]